EQEALDHRRPDWFARRLDGSRARREQLRPRRTVNARSTAGGIGVAFAVGWNIAALGAIATRLSHAYGVGLATIGLFVTVQFVLHMAMQIPGGRAADRFGARRTTLAGLAFIAAGNAVSLMQASVALGFAGRAIVGFGTGLAFVSGSD